MLAIVGLVLCWTVAGGVVLGVLAVILGFVGRGRVKRGEADNGGIAIAGIVLAASSRSWPDWSSSRSDVGLFNEVGGADYVDCVTRAGSDQQAVEECADEFTQRVEDQFSGLRHADPDP